MTTPEKLRRRQRIETFCVIVAILAFGISNVVQDKRDDEQDRCQTNYSKKNSEVQKDRAAINDKRLRNLEAVVGGVAEAKSDEDVAKAIRAFPENRDRLREELRKKPVPEYPERKCG